MYDLVIIGGGPGGYAAALYAHNFGLSVALVERSGFARACTNICDVVDRATDPYRLPRYWVRDWDGDRFQRLVSRWLGHLPMGSRPHEMARSPALPAGSGCEVAATRAMEAAAPAWAAARSLTIPTGIALLRISPRPAGSAEPHAAAKKHSTNRATARPKG